mmetsp:Transcript_18087/g.17448  ORF Transcript_18087/g.17448 Transcript_18087/m.17448 type:complete len:296 (+) Transcript_18087:32-919(+)
MRNLGIGLIICLYCAQQAQSFVPVKSISTSPFNVNYSVNTIPLSRNARSFIPTSHLASSSNRRLVTRSNTGTHLSLSLSQVFPPCLNLGLTKRNTYSLVTGIALLIGYHTRLFLNERKGTLTWRTTQADTREKWSSHVRETEGWIYAVQTLRNAITANTFLATTVISLLTLIAGRIWDILRKTVKGDVGRTRLIAQFISISMCMLASAYEFLQSARLMTHAGFMFPVSTGTKVDEIMRKSQFSQWKGMRWLYLSIGMITWTLGGEGVFLFSSVCLVKFFRASDEPPRNTGKIWNR